MAERRTDRLHILLSTTERTMLDMLADNDGVAPSQLIRGLIRKAFTASGMSLAPVPVEAPPARKRVRS